jgi:hypothetical protein
VSSLRLVGVLRKYLRQIRLLLVKESSGLWNFIIGGFGDCLNVPPLPAESTLMDGGMIAESAGLPLKSYVRLTRKRQPKIGLSANLRAFAAIVNLNHDVFAIHKHNIRVIEAIRIGLRQ